MRRFAGICEAVAATTKKNEKVRLVADYLRSLPPDDAALAVVFLTGRAFPRYEEKVLSVGGSLLWQSITRLTGLKPDVLETIYRKHGDLGATAEEVLAGQSPSGSLTLAGVTEAFEELAERRGTAAKLETLDKVLRSCEPVAAKYVIKIATGDLRIGLKESLVEEAIAAAFGRPPDDVRRANMVAGDIGATLRLASGDQLRNAHFRLFQPVSFMLASPVETAEDAMANFPDGAIVEDKFDGIRAQAHKGDGKAKLFSRTLDEIVEFAELYGPLNELPGEFVLDGEIIGWKDGRPLPFTELQNRLGRKEPGLWLPLEIPAVFVAFDLIYQDGEQLLGAPLSERRESLTRLLPQGEAGRVRMAPAERCASAEQLEGIFRGALARGNEGIMVKAPESTYLPGRRGRFWLKMKQPLGTLDVVVTAVEYGHGKRRGLLSDYTFAVRGEDGLVNIGKAYSGLTDEEIRKFTGFFLDHTVEDQGFRRLVEPLVVVEVAFNNIQRSKRHASGYALRFPRIVRFRSDKPVDEIDTIERVEGLFEKQRSAAGLES